MRCVGTVPENRSYVVIVDTSVWINLLNGYGTLHTEWLSSRIGVIPIGLTDLILCELLQGFRDDREFDRVRDELLAFDILPCVDRDLALQTSQNYRFLRKQGITVRKTIDGLIATFCIERGYALLHHDRDFDSFETHLGLQVIRPLRV